MKIFCIGRNYINHAKELNNPIPSSPLVFMKPPTALLKENKAFYYPKFSNNIHFEVEIVVRIDKNGKQIKPAFAKSYYSSIALGIDFTARDIQDQCKDKGHPWEKAKAFDHSAVLSPFIPLKEGFFEKGISFSLLKNGTVVQKGNTKDMIFNIDALICHLSEYFTLQKGDLIYTGTPEGVGPITIGDQLSGFIENESMFHCDIK